MFKFDFQVETDEDKEGAFLQSGDEKSFETNSRNIVETDIVWKKSEKVAIGENSFEDLDIMRLNCNEIVLDDVKLKYIITGLVLEDIKSNEKSLDMSIAAEQSSDLIPGIYEGGAKLWECTEDLLGYMCKKMSKDDFREKHILDLGCGSGLLGIYALKCDAYVHFQDYNADVLRNVTIPNILINSFHNIPDKAALEELRNKICLYSGDWQSYAEVSQHEHKFDIILTSETIYNEQNYQKLINIFKSRLNRHGFILLTAKSHYFGVGGGTRQFEELLKRDGEFEAKTLWSSNCSVNREIMEIKFVK